MMGGGGEKRDFVFLIDFVLNRGQRCGRNFVRKLPVLFEQGLMYSVISLSTYFF